MSDTEFSAVTRHDSLYINSRVPLKPCPICGTMFRRRVVSMTCSPACAHKRRLQALGTAWTPEQDQHLRRLRDEGGSGSTIAIELSQLFGRAMSRNAVIGRLYRMGLCRPQETLGARWSEGYTARLKEMVAQRCNSREIAAELGISRSAVRNKATRLGLSLMNAKPALSRKRVARIPTIKRETPEEQNSFDASIPIEQRISSILEVTSHTCKWPVGDPQKPDFFFCGAASIPDRPYCREHLCRSVDLSRPAEVIRLADYLQRKAA